MNWSQIRFELEEIVGQTHVVYDPLMLTAHNTDWRGRYQGQAPLVVQPRTTSEVQRVVELCQRHNLALVPQGGNTSQCGASIPRSGHMNEIIISLSKMDQLIELDSENSTITCAAGMILADLQRHAAGAGFLFPLSLASEGSAQVGGLISTNAGGTAVLRYGNMRQQVLGLEVVLADGRCWNGLHGLRKDNTGYDLKQWFIGAEGTLGIITHAVLRLYPQPQQRSTAWLALETPEDAVILLKELRATCGEISAFEIISASALHLVEQHLSPLASPLQPIPRWSLLVELEQFSPGDNPQEQIENALARALADQRIQAALIAQSERESSTFWSLRELISEAQKREGISIKHDISVPVSRIPDFIRQSGEKLSAVYPGIRIVCFGHVGDGNLHYNLSFADVVRNTELIRQTPEVNRIVHDIVHALQGSISAEHGIGQLKVGELERYKDPVALDLMHRIKATLDPHDRMNPGKVLG